MEMESRRRNDELQSSLNPLTMPEIVRSVLAVSSNPTAQEDLPQLRLICKAWYQESLKTWRSTATLTIPADKPSSSSPQHSNSNGVALEGPSNRRRVDEDLHSSNRSLWQRIFSRVFFRSRGRRRKPIPISLGAERVETKLQEFLRLTKEDIERGRNANAVTEEENEEGDDDDGQERKAEKNCSYFLANLTTKPFCNFRLTGWPLSTDFKANASAGLLFPSPHDDPAHEEFWRVAGPWITRLELSGPIFRDVFSFWNILFKLTPSLAELKIVDGIDYSWRQRGFNPRDPPAVPFEGDNYSEQESLTALHIDCSREWPLRWTDVFKGFPNLKNLTLAGCAFHKLHEILGAVATLRKEGRRINNLRNLVVEEYDDQHERLSELTVDSFRDAALPLESLKIELGGGTEQVVVQQLLQTCSASLLTLHLIIRRLTSNSDDDEVAPYDDFLGGPFEHLTDLRLSGPVAANFYCFLQHTPNLERLHLDIPIPTQDEVELLGEVEDRPSRRKMEQLVQNAYSAEGGLVIESLREFKAEGLLLIDNWEPFLRITEWMPNVSRLSAPLSEQTFPVVLAQWKSTLKELHITKEGTLVGEDIIRSWRPFWSTDQEETEYHISDLKELEKFSQDKGNSYMTSEAIEFGFSLLPKLKSLRIFVINEVKEEVLAILKDRNIELSLIQE